MIAFPSAADGCTLYCFDSQTDDYTVEDEAGYGRIRAVSGDVRGLPESSALAESGYLMITEVDGVSFHRVSLQLTAMTLRASRAKDVYLEETETGDGYYLGVIVDGFVKYINMVERDGTVICAYETGLRPLTPLAKSLQRWLPI